MVKRLGELKHMRHVADFADSPGADVLVEAAGVLEHVGHMFDV